MPERSTKLILQRGRLGANSGATEEHMTTANATIRKVFDGFKVTVTMRQDGLLRALTEKTVATYAEAEAVVRAFAAAHEVSWEEVEVVSR